ncbi:polyamine-transporting ATPase 13A3-like isoform X1 [Leptopilina heterotoma]|uniref:polyamine-transporting ATPase 13A3-like isoform X1 n=2 Tax=Leptopilina heterotoma TaxID=63436 RepID=UPI001CA97B1A|nr:polyamine-transporting ATPase 13A3-like isoform X1 [Leptopilina heterotoma]XP_043470601.1 polyamine-transporting ATPase 13A3-like isoform X1 [Leptopilina heterotoma]
MTDVNGLKSKEKPEVQKILANHDVMYVHGFKESVVSTLLIYLTYIITGGLLRLIFHWYPYFQLYATHKKCPLNEATKLLIISNYQEKHKTYFVKNVLTISTKNLGKNSVAKLLNTDDRKLIKNIEGKKLNFHLDNGSHKNIIEYKAFWYKKQCFIWDEETCQFSKLIGLEKYVQNSELHLGNKQGLSKDEQLLRRITYGYNEIIVPVTSIGVLIVLEILNPFYIFQIFTLILWFSSFYYYYATAIVFMSIGGITTSVIETRKNQINLRNTVASTETVRVLRENGEFESVSSAELVPGDVIELPRFQGLVVCDAVLLTGNCIVNESMLTGESVPVTKTPLPHDHTFYNSKDCAHHTLYSGTLIIQTRYYRDKPVLARVIRTGLQTSKGSLVAAILYPPPADFKFDQDSYKFIGILSIIAALGSIYALVSKISRGFSAWVTAVKSLDLITIVIPPALPAAMTVGKIYAQSRLKKRQIYCINNRVINVAGSINCACFDKTGTLTEDGLDMWGVVPSVNNEFEEVEKNVPKLMNHHIFQGMLVCHSLTLIEGELCGDPLDVKMFESTGWTLEEPEVEDTSKYDLLAPTIVKPPECANFTEFTNNEIAEIGIINQYQFSSSLQRMSVIVRILGSKNFKVYTKGSPEMILSLSRPETVPKGIMDDLKKYTEQGYRVIAIGSATLDYSYAKIQRLSREMVEKDLEFLGFVIFDNRLKEPTIGVIKSLRDANIHVLMITGDNIQTAVSVAKECGIVSHDETVINVTAVPGDEKSPPKIFFNAQWLPVKLSQMEESIKKAFESVEKKVQIEKNYRFALTGQTWQLINEYYPEILPKICVRGAVFARMTSDQKQQLVVQLMQLGYYAVMCGDGANDCGALKAAHVGISLSEAESSIASPFTSRIPDITCVPTVIQQGRAALVTSFGIFKFMVTYSLTEFLSAIILYSIDSNVTDLQFLFIDICLIVNFAFFFGKTQAFEGKLSKKAPMTSLLSFTPLFSLALQMLINICFQVAAFHGVKQFSWYVPFKNSEALNYACWENYSVFCVSMFQYITMAIIFSRGKPYRKAIYTNRLFTLSILFMTIVSVYITMYPAEWIINALQLILPPDYDWRAIILVMALINFFLCFTLEKFLVEFLIEKRLKRKFHRIENSRKRYLQIEENLRENEKWPILSKELPILSINQSNGGISTDEKTLLTEKSSNSNNKQYSSINEINQEKSGIENLAFFVDEVTNSENMITKF